MSKYVLRYYQEAAVEAALKLINNNKRKDSGVIICPTGSGKSLIIANIAIRSKKNTLILQPSEEILKQNLKKLQDYGYGEYVGVYSAAMKSRDVKLITLGTIKTVIQRKDLFKSFSLLIVDEGHTFTPYIRKIQRGNKVETETGEHRQLLDSMGNCKLILLTATPFRNVPIKPLGNMTTLLTNMNKHKFGGFCNQIIYEISIQELYKNGYLCPLTYKCYKYSPEALILNNTETNFNTTAYNVNFKLNSVAENACKEVLLQDRKKFIVFTEGINDSLTIMEDMIDKGIDAITVHNGMVGKVRKEAIDGFISGKYRVILNTGILTTGVDIPSLDCIILARKTLSLSLYLQMLGRGVRVCEGKKDCLIIDLMGNVETFGEFDKHELYLDDTNPQNIIHRWRSTVGPLTEVSAKNMFDFHANHNAEYIPGIVNWGEFEGRKYVDLSSRVLEKLMESTEHEQAIKEIQEILDGRYNEIKF